MVECEYMTTTVDSLSLFVLIDTWWNVNKELRLYRQNGIDRFNRYMVECEYRQRR